VWRRHAASGEVRASRAPNGVTTGLRVTEPSVFGTVVQFEAAAAVVFLAFGYALEQGLILAGPRILGRGSPVAHQFIEFANAASKPFDFLRIGVSRLIWSYPWPSFHRWRREYTRHAVTKARDRRRSSVAPG